MLRQTILNTRYDWPIDCGPATNIDRSVYIGVRRVIARHAPKLILGLAVLFGCVSAFGALPAGISRIDSDHRNTSKSGLVCQEQAKLGERPRVQNCTLLTPNRNPFTNAGQFFDRQTAPGAFSISNNLLTDSVIYAGGKSPLSTGETFQLPLGSPRLLSLEFCPQLTMAVSNTFNLCAGVPLTVAGRCDISHSKINSEEVCWFTWRGTRQIDSTIQVKLPLAEDEIGLPFDAVEPLLLIFPVDQRDDNSAIGKSPQADAVQPFKSHNAFIIGDRTVGFEDRANLLVTPKTFNGLADSTNSHLRRQAESDPDFQVCEFVDRWLAEDSSIEASTGGECRSLIYTLYSFQQPVPLFWVGKELQLERQFHYTEYITPCTLAAKLAKSFPAESRRYQPQD